MGKYPALNYKVISNCIGNIKTVEFDTYDFINVLNIIDRGYLKLFSGIGKGWKSVIGKNLSNYSIDTKIIQKKKRRGNAQLWMKH